jgi:hypothetical protein
LHVEDSGYWEELYWHAFKPEEYAWLAGRFGNANSVFTTLSHELYAICGGALSPFSSKQRVLQLKPTIRKKLETLCNNIAKYKDTAKILGLIEYGELTLEMSLLSTLLVYAMII